MTIQEALGVLDATVADQEVKDVITQAAKKQIPVTVYQYAVQRFSCRSCQGNVYPKQKFCEHCGQALDWRFDNAEIH